MQVERAPLARQLLRHAEDGRDADAAGKQQRMLGTRGEREVVARRADREHVAFAHGVQQPGRAAARLGIAQHADAVTPRLRWQFAQRILAHRPVGHVHVDVRTCIERREGVAFHRHEIESRDALGHQGLGGHADLHQLFHRLPREM